jgi:hypothetical protein
MAHTFGARFVEEFQRSGSSTAAWPPAALEALRNADRRTFIEALREGVITVSEDARHRRPRSGTGNAWSESNARAG